MELGEAVKSYVRESVRRKGQGGSGSGFRDSIDRQVRYLFSTITKYVECPRPLTLKDYVRQQVMEALKSTPSVTVNQSTGVITTQSTDSVLQTVASTGTIRVASINPPLGYIGDKVVAFAYVRPVKIGQTYAYTMSGSTVLVQGDFEGKIGKAMRYPIPFTLSGFICSPRSHSHFHVTEYMPETQFQEEKRTYTVPGGWGHDRDKKLYQLDTVDIIYPQDANRAAYVMTESGEAFKGRFLADEEPRFGNFYFINPRDSNKILTWMGTPTRHGGLVYTNSLNIAGVVSTEESVGFGVDIYRAGRVVMKGPKVNDYHTDRCTNPYAIVLACGWTLIDDREHVIIVASYTHKPEGVTAVRRLSVFTTIGSPTDGDMYDEIDHPRGWVERFHTNKTRFHLPWFISDDGKFAVCSDGDTLNMSDVDAITYSENTHDKAPYEFEHDGHGTVTWGFSYSDPRCISEEVNGARASMPITVSSAMTKGGRIATTNATPVTSIDIRGHKPDECKGGVLFYQGKPWYNPGCEAGFTTDDPKPERRCTSCPDGDTYAITLTGTGAISGITCRVLKTIPYGGGTWVRSCQNTDFDCCAPYAECQPSLVTRTCDTMVGEVWVQRSMTTRSPEGVCGNSSGTMDYFGIRDIEVESGSGECTHYPPWESDPTGFSWTRTTFIACITIMTWTYVCNE